MFPLFSLSDFVAAGTNYLTQWTPGIDRGRIPRLLRYLIIKFYGAGGSILNARIEIAQETLAGKVNIKRAWCNVQLGRLVEAGWICVYAPKLPNGMNARSVITLGPKLKQMVYILQKTAAKPAKALAKAAKSAMKSAVRRTKHFLSYEEEKRLKTIHAREQQPPTPELLRHIPLLGTWLKRGKTDTP
jgi:hypothetical protein